MNFLEKNACYSRTYCNSATVSEVQIEKNIAKVEMALIGQLTKGKNLIREDEKYHKTTSIKSQDIFADDPASELIQKFCVHPR